MRSSTICQVDDNRMYDMYMLDCFSGSDCGWNAARQNLEDPMHQVANSVGAMYCLALDIGTFKFSMKRRQVEVDLDRFPELEVQTYTDDEG